MYCPKCDSEVEVTDIQRHERDRQDYDDTYTIDGKVIWWCIVAECTNNRCDYFMECEIDMENVFENIERNQK
jgi:hypothetical protein